MNFRFINARYNRMLFLFVFLVHVVTTRGDYWSDRITFMEHEKNESIGGSLLLNREEKIVNQYLMTSKYEEIASGVSKPASFAPAMHFFKARPLIEKSAVFKFIKNMPKGALLHGHDTALASEPYMYSLTFRPNLYACVTDKEADILYFQFFKKAPITKGKTPCKWKLVSEWRKKSKKVATLNKFIRSKISLLVDDPHKEYPDINVVWNRFIGIFIRITPMLTYRPVFEEQFYQVLLELYQDNVKYIEMRGTLPSVYELNGTTYDPIQVAGFYVQTCDRFMKKYPDFYGARLIYAPLRKVSNETMESYVKTAIELKQTYPNFIAGFDLVGQEDLGEPLEKFIPQLLQLQSTMKLFFHAGETNWNGITDNNLIDAVLLGTTRIGHAYALLKHPEVLNAVKEKGIGLEVNVISNQVLKLVEDIRNHPGAVFFTRGLPVVISSDDPGFWGAKALSYDFYVAFMGLTSLETDLKMLKQVARNSLTYSAIPDEEKHQIIEKWETEWFNYINNFINTMKLN